MVRQRARVAALAVEQFQGDNLAILELSAVLDGDSPRQVSNQMAAVGDVLNQGAASLDRLKATRVLLTVQEQRVEMAKRLVAGRRTAAAKNLARTEAARERAAHARDHVARLVRSRATAKRAARAAVREERERLAALRQERRQIRQMLAERARRARLRAAAANSYVGTSTGYLDVPVDAAITSSYGMRMHPILHILEMHDGTDFGAACGTPVRAAADGLVLSAYFNPGYGNRLIVGDGFVDGVSLATSYNHLRRMTVFPGDRVERGDVIGYVGSTGFSTGCHLHFMVYENGRTVDPVTWL